MMLMALTDRDITSTPIPTTNLNLLPSTLPTHPFAHNSLLTESPWNLSLVTDYTPAPHRIIPTPASRGPYSRPAPPQVPPHRPSRAPTSLSTVATRPHPAPTAPVMRPPPTNHPTSTNRPVSPSEWRYQEPNPLSIHTMTNQFTTPTKLSFDLSLINRDIWDRLLPTTTSVNAYASSLYRHMTQHPAFSRLIPLIDLLLTAFIHCGFVMQVHICNTSACRRLHTHPTLSNCTITARTLTHVYNHLKSQWRETDRHFTSLRPQLTQAEHQVLHI
eukprot:3434436-Amphidinium_carterae.1